MFTSIKLYVIGALALLLVTGTVYVQRLQHRAAAQAERIGSLEETERNLREAQRALEEVVAKRQATTTQTNAIRKEVDHAPDTGALPVPIERALDGLRDLQARRKGRGAK